MIPIEEVIDTLHEARIAYIVTIGIEGDIMAVIIGGNPEGVEPTPEHEITCALDAILAGEQQQPETPQVLTNWIGLNEPLDYVDLN